MGGLHFSSLFHEEMFFSRLPSQTGQVDLRHGKSKRRASLLRMKTLSLRFGVAVLVFSAMLGLGEALQPVSDQQVEAELGIIGWELEEGDDYFYHIYDGEDFEAYIMKRTENGDVA